MIILPIDIRYVLGDLNMFTDDMSALKIRVLKTSDSAWGQIVRCEQLIEINMKIIIDTLINKLPPTLSDKTYAFKYLPLYHTLMRKFNSTNFKNLRYSICFIVLLAAVPSALSLKHFQSVLVKCYLKHVLFFGFL